MKRKIGRLAVFTLATLVLALTVMNGKGSVETFPSSDRQLYVSNSANEQDPQGDGANVARFVFDAWGCRA